MEWTEFELSNAPSVTGVYGFKWKEQWLYVGKSGNIAMRLKNHNALRFARELDNISYWYIASRRIAREAGRKCHCFIFKFHVSFGVGTLPQLTP